MIRPKASTLFAAAWVAVQLALPLQYYLVRWYDDPVDEAFAWRMFSDTFHSASRAEWFWFDGNVDDGMVLTKSAFVSEVGLSRQWAAFVTGEYRTHARAPTLWTMQRTAAFMCEALAAKHANLTAVGAIRSGAPWDGAVWEQGFVWDC